MPGAPSFLCPFSWASMPPELTRPCKLPSSKEGRYQYVRGQHELLSGCANGSKRMHKESEDRIEPRAFRPRRRIAPYFVKVLRSMFPHDGPQSQSGSTSSRSVLSDATLLPVYHANPLRINVHQISPCSHLALKCCNWQSIPPEMDVAQKRGSDGVETLPGTLPIDRVERKRQQVLNMVVFAAPLIHEGILQKQSHPSKKQSERFTVVDFCCGSGWQSLPLAYAFPSASFILIDCKERSLDVAKERALRAGLSNVKTLLLSIENFKEPFDLGIALHACGQASDIAIEKCVSHGAAFVVAPCCVGKVQSRALYTTVDNSQPMKSKGHSADLSGNNKLDPGIRQLTYPRSALFRSNISRPQYDAVAKAADFGHGGFDNNSRKAKWSRERRVAKSIVEWDRGMSTREKGYHVYLSRMEPPSCTPKNDVLVGWPKNRQLDRCTGKELKENQSRQLFTYSMLEEEMQISEEFFA